MVVGACLIVFDINEVHLYLPLLTVNMPVRIWFEMFAIYPIMQPTNKALKIIQREKR